MHYNLYCLLKALVCIHLLRASLEMSTTWAPLSESRSWQIMLIKNEVGNPEDPMRLVNGSRGVVTGFCSAQEAAKEVELEIQQHDDEVKALER